ncbi:MAG: hypothetical protein WCD44_00255, partial [Candidatus Babeliales bacterium]
VEEKRALQPTVLVVIGIGGSHLGTAAIHEALFGKFYNEQNPPIKVYFADTVDTDYIYDIILLVEQAIEEDHHVLINVVSKSGRTTETIANFEIFLYLLQHYRGINYHHYVVVTTDEDSPLWELAGEKKLTRLAIPKKVGGRYSVFSAVSLFPLALLGVNIDQLLAGARSIVSVATSLDIFNNMSALSAAILYRHYKNNITVHDSFLFPINLEGIGKWYRQLLGESIGKEYNKQGKKVNIGMTPTVSMGSADLHSVGQLYLGGPYNKFTTFITVQKSKSDVLVPNLHEFEQLVAHIQGKQLPLIMDAILQGVYTAYKKNKRPFVSIVLPEKSAYYIGQLLQFKMIEIMYLGYLLDINPFDQPQVELYKKETRKILAHE